MIEPGKYAREESLSQARVFFNHCCQETSQRLATALLGARLRSYVANMASVIVDPLRLT